MLNIWIDSFARAGGIEVPANRSVLASSVPPVRRPVAGSVKAAAAWLAAYRTRVQRDRALAMLDRLDTQTLADIGVIRGRISELRRPANRNSLPSSRVA